eukprot:g29483.t1
MLGKALRWLKADYFAEFAVHEELVAANASMFGARAFRLIKCFFLALSPLKVVILLLIIFLLHLRREPSSLEEWLEMARVTMQAELLHGVSCVACLCLLAAACSELLPITGRLAVSEASPREAIEEFLWVPTAFTAQSSVASVNRSAARGLEAIQHAKEVIPGQRKELNEVMNARMAELAPLCSKYMFRRAELQGLSAAQCLAAQGRLNAEQLMLGRDQSGQLGHVSGR